jgi:hypothetical protein
VLCGAKQVKECGILSSPNPNPARTLDLAVAYAVEKFCCGNSVSIAKSGNSLSEVYAEFESHPNVKIGLSK